MQNWKDISPRVGISLDVFGDGRTALKASVARYVAGQQIAVADDINPVSALSITDRRPWTTDLDGNGSPLDANGNIQFNELGTSTATPTFGRNVSTTSYDPSVLNGWFKRGNNSEYTIAAQHQLGAAHVDERRLVPPVVRQPDVHRRPALRQSELRRSVLRQRAGRSEAAGRRRLSRCATCST